MPLYEYQCKTCGYSFERMIRWSETDRIPSCPNCQSLDTHKKISIAATLGSSSNGNSNTSCASGSRFS